MRSFLNLIEIESGREIRLAEFGFHASSPSFVGDVIIFQRDGKWWKLSPESGWITAFEGEIPTKEHSVELRFTSPFEDGVAYCEMVMCERVLVRFMGAMDSLGSSPISEDGCRIVFFGYPAREFGI